MACPVTKESIENSLQRRIEELSKTQSPQEINSLFGVDVFNEDNVVDIPESLVDQYEDAYETQEGILEGQQVFLQIQNQILPKSSPLTLRKVKIMMERMGVNYETVKNIVVNGKELNANGVALPLQSLIQVTEGQEQALPEEAFHIALEILEQTNKGLVNQMLSQATSLPIWNQVYEQYKDIYNNNLRKIKKEAIAKQLVIESNQSWWQKALNFLKNLFRETQVDLSPFRDALSVLTNNNIGTVRNTLLNNYQYVKEQGIEDAAAQNIIQLANSDISDESLQEAIQQYLPENAFLQVGGINVNETYNKLISPKDETTIPSIQDQAEKTLKEKFGNTKNFIDAWDEVSNQENRDGHKDVQDILRRYIDEQGNLRENPLRDTNESSDKYDDIEDLVADKLVSFPKDTKFLINKTIVGNQKAKVDLIAVTNNGVVSTYNFIASNDPDISNFKKSLYSSQAQLIKNILREGYGIRKSGQNRYIPMSMQAEEIQNDSYIEITPITDRTNIQKVDKFLDALNSRINALRTAKNKREEKSLQVTSNSIIGAINDLLVNSSFKKLVSLGQAAVNDAESVLQDSNNRTQDYFSRIALVQDNLIALKDINSIIAAASKTKNTSFSGNKQGLSRAESISTEAGELLGQIQELLDTINNENAEKQGVRNILNPEAAVSTVTKWFRKLSQAQTKAAQYLYKLTSTLDSRINTQLLERMPALGKLRTEVIEWAKSKGIKEKDILSQILKKDKFELIDQYNKEEFVTGLVQAQTNRDEQWIKDNVNLSEFYKWRNKEREDLIYELEQRVNSNEENNEQQLKWFDETFDIFSENNIKIRQFITDKFLSEDYKRIQKEKPLFDLYSYIRNLNNEAEKAGALQEYAAKVVVPMIRKDLLDKFAFGGTFQFGTEFFKSLVGTDSDFQYGQRDPQTGEVIDKIPFYYITDISTKNPDGTRNYKNVSTDIFKVLAIYEKQVLKYSAYAAIEDEASLMLRGERAKSSLPTGRFGDVIQGEAVVPNNDVNAKYFENFIRAKVYGQKNIGHKWDERIVKLSLGAAKKINNALGREVINTDYDKAYVSLTGAIDGMNKFFQMKVLGLNPVVSIANFFGGNMQAVINAAEYFTKNELRAAELEYAGTIASRDGKTAAILDYFDYLYDGERTREKSNQLSFSKITQSTIQEKLYLFQRVSEKPIQGAIGIALARNTIIENGELVNIRQYLKNSEKYQNRFNLPQSERDALQKEFEKDVKKLQERSILNIAEVQDDKLVIPGIERTSDVVSKYIAFNQQITRQATGGGNQDDIRQINMLLLGRSAMVFKSWMPGLLLNRFQGLTYNVGRDAYEMGRITAFAQNLSFNLVKSAQDLYGIVTNNDRGIQLLKERYQIEKEKYLNRTGQDEFEKQFTEADFIDMYTNLIKGQMQETLMLSAIMGIILYVGANQPPEDEELKLGSWKWALRNLNKIEDELSFFYNPLKLENAVNGGLLPAAGVMKDLIKLGSHTTKELGALIYNDPEAAEKAKPSKYLLKAVPVLKQLDQFIVIFNSELAQNMGIDISVVDQTR